MIVDQFEEVLMKTLHPVPTAKPSVAPIPSVVPTPVDLQIASESGHKTLWVVFVLMVIASGTFTALSWKVQLVRHHQKMHCPP